MSWALATGDPERLSRELRHGRGEGLGRRRAIVALGLTASASLAIVALYQVGVLSALPDPPLRRFDAERVVGSEAAYALLSTPDAILGLGSYAATVTLAAMGGADRARRRPWLPLALFAKIGFDAVQAGTRARGEWTRHRAFCALCLVAAGATFAMVPLAIPEARRALARVARR